MLLDIYHRTVYRYSVPARRVMQVLRLWPAACDHQRVLQWQVDVDGRAVQAMRQDGFGNPTAVHSIEGSVEEVVIEVRGKAEVLGDSGVVRGSSDTLPASFFLGSTELTTADADIRALAQQVKQVDPLSTLHALMTEVRARIAFSDGQTDSLTPAAQALQLGAGVCQDHAHVMLAAARSLDMAARYVSGYLWISGERAEPASHAWCEVDVPQLGWVGFDPANGTSPNEGYVRIAVGRDANEAAPIRGWREGIGSEEMEVTVRVAEHSNQQQ